LSLTDPALPIVLTDGGDGGHHVARGNTSSMVSMRFRWSLRWWDNRSRPRQAVARKSLRELALKRKKGRGLWPRLGLLTPSVAFYFAIGLEVDRAESHRRTAEVLPIGASRRTGCRTHRKALEREAAVVAPASSQSGDKAPHSKKHPGRQNNRALAVRNQVRFTAQRSARPGRTTGTRRSSGRLGPP